MGPVLFLTFASDDSDQEFSYFYFEDQIMPEID